MVAPEEEDTTSGLATIENESSPEVIRGPDLNPTRSFVDRKLYRQILLPNGMRCVLIQSTDDMQSFDPVMGFHEDEEIPEEEYKEDEKEIEDTSEDEDGDNDDEGDDDKGSLRKAAATILVGAGSMYDPESCQGLAHFLEHLLFMGSEKYPGENEYDTFVSSHGGSDNAYTEWEYTCYSLDIPQEYLWPALDRLAQFFVAPLLLTSAVDRELLAIESEFKLHTNSDHIRWEQVLCATAVPGHPVAKFSWGNLKSLRDIPKHLGVDPLKELRKFYNNYYYAANMRVVVIGAYSLDEMERKVSSMFASVPALPREPGHLPLPVPVDKIGTWDCKYTSPMQDAGMPYSDGGKVYRLVPVRDIHTITINWCIPPIMKYWKSKPTDFLGHLLGHEAEGSIFSYLREMSWVTTCSAGTGDEGSDQASCHAMFTVSFTLSETGVENWKSVVETVYGYIGILRKYSQEGWPSWIYEELRQTQELAYRYANEQSPDEVADSIAENMAPHYMLPPERLLDGADLLFDFEPTFLNDVLTSYLTPRKGNIYIFSSKFGKASEYEDSDENIINPLTTLPDVAAPPEPDLFTSEGADAPNIEPMMKTRFWCHTLPSDWLDTLEATSQPKDPTEKIRLPPQNPFVPSNLDLKPLPDTDSRHPLVNCSLKVCTIVGKKNKQWFPALVSRYDRKKGAVLLTFEDGDEKWQSVDDELHVFSDLNSGFESTLENRTIRYRVTSTGSFGARFAEDGAGDQNDPEGGLAFPIIPPAAPADRLPKEISSSNTLRMWWMQDRQFHRPIAELRIAFICRKANTSPLHKACAELMVGLCQDALTEVAYLAEMCELFSCISSTDDGFYIRINGFNDKMLLILKAVLNQLLSFRACKDALPASIKNERFDSCLEVLRRRYTNFGMTASKLSSNVRLRTLRVTLWSANQKQFAIENITIPRFSQTAAEILEEAAIECLLHGNFDRSGADEVKNVLLDLMKQNGVAGGLARKHYPSHSMYRLPIVTEPTTITIPSKDPQEPNTSVEVYVQIGKDSLRDRVLIDLIVHMMDEPFYDQVRTKDQFGYTVWCDRRWSWGITGIIFGVVTNTKSAQQTVDRIDQFLREFRPVLADMSKEAFLKHVIAVAHMKVEMFNSLTEEAGSYWGEITDGRFDWQCWRNEAEFLRTVNKEEVLKAFDKWLMPGGKRSIMTVNVIGLGEEECQHGRPECKADAVDDYCDEQVEIFHKACKNQFWGRINSKLF